MTSFDQSDLPEDLRPPAARDFDKAAALAALNGQIDRRPVVRVGRWAAPIVAAGVLAAAVFAAQALSPSAPHVGDQSPGPVETTAPIEVTAPAESIAPTPPAPTAATSEAPPAPTPPVPTAATSEDPPAPTPTSTPSMKEWVPVDHSKPGGFQSPDPANAVEVLDLDYYSLKGADLDAACLTEIEHPYSEYRFDATQVGVTADGLIAVYDGEGVFTACDGALGNSAAYLKPAPVDGDPTSRDYFKFSAPNLSWEHAPVPIGSSYIRPYAAGPMTGLSSVSYHFVATDGEGNEYVKDVEAEVVGDYWVVSTLIELPDLEGAPLDVTVTVVTTDGETVTHRITPEDFWSDPESMCRHAAGGC